MGQCCGSGNRKPPMSNVKRMSRSVKKGEPAPIPVVKILFLGASDAGKTTVVKQLLLLDERFSEEDHFGFKEEIFVNVLGNMKNLCDFVKQQQWQVSEANRPLFEEITTAVYDPDRETVIDEQMAKQFKNLWADPRVVQAYNRRNEFQWNDSTAYFMGHIEKIAKSTYRPTAEDIVMTRQRTIGVSNILFYEENFDVDVFDVGGQRNERKKWINLWNEHKLSAIIFVVAVSEYDQKLHEDEMTNRLRESLNVFMEVMQVPELADVRFFLFLNKVDLFKEKMTANPSSLAKYFPKYPQWMTENGIKENNWQTGLEFIRAMFEEPCDKLDRKLVVQVLNSTSKDEVKKVYKSVLTDLAPDQMGSRPEPSVTRASISVNPSMVSTIKD